jgi:hypothetical protein
MRKKRNEPPTQRYELVSSISCDCSASTLRVAMFNLGPAFQYDLFVAPGAALDTQVWVKEVTRSELSYQVNVHPAPLNHLFEWYLQANGRRVGSKGA